MTIELHVPDKASLFESHPAGGKPTLQASYREYLFQKTQRMSPKKPLTIQVRTRTPVDAADLQRTFRAQCARVAEEEREAFRSLLRYGGLFAGIGFSLLLLLLWVSSTLRPQIETPFLKGLVESLNIFGTVALWRPAEILLYDWIPIYQKARRLQAMSESLRVEVIPSANPG
jgi:hypothetical protein